MPNCFSFNLGADPEFKPALGNRPLSADAVLEAVRNGREINGAHGNLGCDGCSSTGELRPAPSKDPSALAANIGALLRSYYTGTALHKLPDFRIYTHSLFAPTGGHIHVELDGDMRTNDRKRAGAFKALTACLLPLVLNDDPASFKVRYGGSYGKIGDARLSSPKDNVRTLEVRAPSAEWMTTPRIAEGTLAYVGVCWHEIVNNRRHFNKAMEGMLMDTHDTADRVAQLYVGGFKLPVLMANKKIRQAVRTFELYPQFKAQIDYVLDAKRVLKDKQAVGFDAVLGWGLKQTSQNGTSSATSTQSTTKRGKYVKSHVGLREFLNMAAVSAKEDEARSILGNALPARERMSSRDFVASSDTGVDEMVSTLVRHASAYGMRPHAPVYFFGMRKGLNADKPLALTFRVDGRMAALNTLSDSGLDADSLDTLTRMTERARGNIAPSSDGRLTVWGIPHSWRIGRKQNNKFMRAMYELMTATPSAPTADEDN